MTDICIEILNRDVQRLHAMKQELLLKLSVEEYEHIVAGWEKKLNRCLNGNQGWGMIFANKWSRFIINTKLKLYADIQGLSSIVAHY